VLWRVVYGQGSKALTNFSAGPWHPDKEHIERWAAWLRGQGQEAQVQSSTQAVSRLLGGHGDRT
jgi:hypothetical protein